jgi:hypothetical protein
MEHSPSEVKSLTWRSRNSLPFLETWNFITMFTQACHWCLPFDKKKKQSHYTPLWRLGREEYSSYSFLTSALYRGEWSPSRFALGKGPLVPIVQEAGWASEPVRTQTQEEKSFASAGDRTPIALSSSPYSDTILTELPRSLSTFWQIKEIHTLIQYLWSILIVPFHLCLDLPSALYPPVFPTKFLCTSHFTHACYITYPPHSPLYYHSNNILLESKNYTPQHYPIYSLSCNFLPLKSKYSPKHSVHKDPQYLVLLWCDRWSFMPIQTSFV